MAVTASANPRAGYAADGDDRLPPGWSWAIRVIPRYRRLTARQMSVEQLPGIPGLSKTARNFAGCLKRPKSILNGLNSALSSRVSCWPGFSAGAAVASAQHRSCRPSVQDGDSGGDGAGVGYRRAPRATTKPPPTAPTGGPIMNAHRHTPRSLAFGTLFAAFSPPGKCRKLSGESQR